MAKKKIYWGWYVIGVGTLAFMFTYGLRGSYGVFLPSMLKELEWSRTLISGAVSIGLVLNAVLAPLLGFVVDRYGAKWMLVFGASLIGTAFLGMGVFTEVWQYYVLYGFFFAAGINFMGRVISYTMSVNWFIRKRATAVAIVGAGTGLGSFIFNPMSSVLIENFGWRHSFMILGVACLAILIPLSIIFVKQRPEDIGLLPDGDDPSDQSERNKFLAGVLSEAVVTVKEGIRNRNFWLLFFGNTFYSIPAYLVGTHLVIFAVDQDIPVQTAAFAVGLLGGIGIMTRLIFGYVADKFNNRRIPIICGLSIYILAFVYLLFYVNTTPTLIAFVVVMAMGTGGVAMFPGLVGDNFGRLAMGSFMGFMSFGAAIGASIGPIWAGWVYDTYGNYDYAWMTAMACHALAAMCFILMGKSLFQIKMEEKARQQQQKQAA